MIAKDVFATLMLSASATSTRVSFVSMAAFRVRRKIGDGSAISTFFRLSSMGTPVIEIQRIGNNCRSGQVHCYDNPIKTNGQRQHGMGRNALQPHAEGPTHLSS
jgi:hypothetical protein